MDTDLPTPYRLIVKCAGEQRSQGTAWFVTRSSVVTALHVIDELPNATYELETEVGNIHLEYVPGTEDREGDIAVLRVADEDRQKVQSRMVLLLADRQPGANAKWSARGFPERREGKEQTADGAVSNPSMMDGRMQLFLRQGTDEAWEGISGAAVMVDGRVVGVLTVQSGQRDSTAYAVPYTRVERVLPALKGRTHRSCYRQWFRAVYAPPAWSCCFTPRFFVRERELTSDQLGTLIASSRDKPRVWLIVGDSSHGAKAMLRRVAQAFMENGTLDNDDAFDLPILWSATERSHNSADPLAATERRLCAETTNGPTIVENLRLGLKNRRALFVVEDPTAADIETLRCATGATCNILASVDASVAAEITDAETCQVTALSDADRQRLTAYWLAQSQDNSSVDAETVAPSLASRSLDVLIWSRAELCARKLRQLHARVLTEGTAGNADELCHLLDALLLGAERAEQLKSYGMSNEDDEVSLSRELLADLSYLSLVEGVDEITPAYVEKARADALELPEGMTAERLLAQISDRSRVLQRDDSGVYRYAHPVLQEYLAALAMCGAKLRQDMLVADAGSIYQDAERISKWSRAFALRLDMHPGDARELMGALLSHGLLEGSGTRLRSKSGPLSDCVCRAVLHSERLGGRRLREAIGWSESPDDWTGYRPDEWRTIEELLRYLDGLARRIPDDAALALMLQRFLRDAKVIDIALVRYSMAKELKRRAQSKTPTRELECLYARNRFFEAAGRSITRCAEVKLDFRVVDEGWFLMGAPEAEEYSWPNERPRHRVRLRKFLMASTEVTNEQYEVFDPDHRQYRCSRHPRPGEAEPMSKPQHPVVRVSWYEAWCFAEWLGFKLPTEAQWEKAARGKNQKDRPEKISEEPAPYWFSEFGADLSNIVWFKDNSRGSGTKEVDTPISYHTRLTHNFQLGGLCGNVWEWCMDEQGFKYTQDDRDGPKAYEHESNGDVIINRTIRGGSCDSPAWNCRHAVRQFTFPTVRADTIGFRLCK